MAQKILILQSAPVKRVEQGIRDIGRRGLFSDPEFTVFSRRHRSVEARLRANPSVGRLLVRESGWNPWHDLARLRRERFESVVVFFTGERGYWKMKWMAPWLGAPRVWIYAGDGEMFELRPATYLRFLQARWRKRRPQDFMAFQDDDLEPPPERVLVLQSAPAGLVAEGIRRIHAQSIFRHPEITVFVREKAAGHSAWSTLDPAPRLEIHPPGMSPALTHLRRVRVERYDALVLFLTGDPSYRKIKAFAFLCGVRRRLIFNENLDCFFFSAGRGLRFLARRLWQGVSPMTVAGPFIDEGEPERVLVLQSAAPEVVAAALERIRERRLFRRPQITLFLRQSERSRAYFSNHPDVQRVQTHARTEKVLAHLRALRRERYDVAVLLLTGDPSYWKIKYFAFLCGARHLLIFNAHLDYFFFTPRAFLRFLLDHWRQQIRTREVSPHALLLTALLTIVRPLVFPFRFAYLLLYFLALKVRMKDEG